MLNYGLPIFSYKRLRVAEKQRNSDETKMKRIEYIRQYRELELSGCEFIIIDETPFNVLEFRRRGRAPVGQTAFRTRQKAKITNITAITAISSLRGVIHVLFVVGKVDHKIFIMFMNGLLLHLQQSALSSQCTYEPMVFIMDNALIHHDISVLHLLQDNNHRVLYTAPYSCEINPIEYVFGIFKTLLKIPYDCTKVVAYINHLQDGFQRITSRQVRRCIMFVTNHLFSRVLLKQSLLMKELQRIFAQQMDLAGELTIFVDEIDQDTSNDRNVDIKKQKRCQEILDLQDENEIIVQQPIQRKRLRRSSTTNSSQTSSSEQIFTHINDS
ncbi:MAG: hypothetical protein EZS28_041629 [Streblomastix strix]|uniref:Tc1-like transposase DDE domain-containing protein n=1 Tax=Streblomastix strix TaxID=222440 RepID=A0A5J4TX15_9EUKA|nr:MAG: hypothetical protein EZS28_041629 [Streblomastix strix]